MQCSKVQKSKSCCVSQMGQLSVVWQPFPTVQIIVEVNHTQELYTKIFNFFDHQEAACIPRFVVPLPSSSKLAKVNLILLTSHYSDLFYGHIPSNKTSFGKKKKKSFLGSHRDSNFLNLTQSEDQSMKLYFFSL